MGVAKKGRRKFNYNGAVFYWYVADWDLEEDYPLHIMSEDKTVQMRYGSVRFGLYINQAETNIIVIKSDKMNVGQYSFSLDLNTTGILPSDIRRILDWHYNSTAG